MKKPFILLLTFLLFSLAMHAQTVKQSTKDTAKYRANDRLRTAGPKQGWKNKNNMKIDSIKSKNDTVAVKPKIDTLKKRN
jgi:hypothetical protein